MSRGKGGSISRRNAYISNGATRGDTCDLVSGVSRPIVLRVTLHMG